MSELVEKFQIIAFYTNKAGKSPNDIMDVFLSKQNHKLQRKTKDTLSFTFTIPQKPNQTKVMMITVSNLQQEYTGINDVNCYFIVVDLEMENYNDELNKIWEYVDINCDISKKFFIFGLYEQNMVEKQSACAFIKDKCHTRNIKAIYHLTNINDPLFIEAKVLEMLKYCGRHKMKKLPDPEEEPEEEEPEEKKKETKRTCIII